MMANDLNIQYRIAKLHLADFAILVDVFDSSNMEVSVNTEFQFEYEKTQNIIACRVNVVYSYDYDDIMRASMEGYFMINPDSIESLSSNNKIIIPSHFLVQIASITYGSMRGALCVKTEETPLNSFVLPPLYVRDVVKNDMIVN